MALFGRKQVAAVGTSQDPEIKAAVGYGTGGNAGASQINNFYAYTNGEMRQIAMRVPTIYAPATLWPASLVALN